MQQVQPPLVLGSTLGFAWPEVLEASSLLMGCGQLHSELNLFAAAITEGMILKNLQKKRFVSYTSEGRFIHG